MRGIWGEGSGSRPQGGGQGTGQVRLIDFFCESFLIEAWGRAMLGGRSYMHVQKGREEEGRDRTGVWGPDP